MMTAAPVELPPLGSCSPGRSSGGGQRFYNLCGVRWRINLGLLPSSPLDSIEDLRRAAADSRRRYATLRRLLLTDPHTMKDGNRSPDYVMDNPLSQNPESTWGRFFRNAELEKMIDQDLSRLYPEDGSYFQTPACQAMLRRVLLVWCLRHPECGYRQGMHELFAPLLYVLHVDVDYLSKVRGLYDTYFNDEFDGLSYPESELVSHYRVKKAKSWDLGGNDDDFYEVNEPKITCFDDLDPAARDVFLLSDAYGAEGELGVVISERFMEHDGYNLFNGLMGGSHRVLAMADFFSISPAIGSSMCIPPVIEASSAIYHLLSIVDSSLHSHLVELGVEPQYFALRWLRVLFGREFSLDDLLVIWDELFSSPNDSHIENDEYSFRVLLSPRGAFISAMAVSMLLHVRSSLLATENATSCLQRLLNFPRNIDVKKLIDKAKSYQGIAWESYIIGSSQASSNMNRSSDVKRACSVSQNTPIRTLPDSYWEEKWQVLHKEEKLQKIDLSKGGNIKELLGRKLWLCRTASDPFPSKSMIRKKQEQSPVRRKLLDDLAQVLDFEGDAVQHILPGQGPPVNEDVGKCSVEEQGNKNIIRTSEEPCYQNTTKTSDCIAEETYLRMENSSVLSMSTGPSSEGNDTEIESEKSSLTSNSFIGDNEDDNSYAEEYNSASVNSVPKDKENNAARTKFGASEDLKEKGVPEMKERKSLSEKFQWFWRFGKGVSPGAIAKAQRSPSFGNGSVCKGTLGSSASNSSPWGDNIRIEVGDKKVKGALKNLGQSMLENIQVIESVFQQERGQASNILGGKGQTTAMAALKELRKVSYLLSEM